jgi:hypothetical protein
LSRGSKRKSKGDAQSSWPLEEEGRTLAETIKRHSSNQINLSEQLLVLITLINLASRDISKKVNHHPHCLN